MAKPTFARFDIDDVAICGNPHGWTVNRRQRVRKGARAGEERLTPMAHCASLRLALLAVADDTVARSGLRDLDAALDRLDALAGSLARQFPSSGAITTMSSSFELDKQIVLLHGYRGRVQTAVADEGPATKIPALSITVQYEPAIEHLDLIVPGLGEINLWREDGEPFHRKVALSFKDMAFGDRTVYFAEDGDNDFVEAQYVEFNDFTALALKDRRIRISCKLTWRAEDQAAAWLYARQRQYISLTVASNELPL